MVQDKSMTIKNCSTFYYIYIFGFLVNKLHSHWSSDSWTKLYRIWTEFASHTQQNRTP